MNSKLLTEKEVVLVVDDEPQYLDWLFEYLKSKGFDIVTATTLADGLRALNNGKYRAILADLSIPVSDNLSVSLAKQGEAYVKYPGLYLAHTSRNKGYRGRQVVVYSVHDAQAVREVANLIGVCYITKGRPRLLKSELDGIFSYDPSKKGGSSVQ